MRLKDSRGLRVLAELMARPGEELHVLQLVSPGEDARDVGDAAGDLGPLLDTDAVRSYRRRLLDLRDELDEAERFHDEGRAARAQAEVEAITAELASAVGLGGRARKSGAAERARTAVQKRVRGAIRRMEEELPEVARHLDQTVRTGVFCAYLPEGRRRR